MLRRLLSLLSRIRRKLLRWVNLGRAFLNNPALGKEALKKFRARRARIAEGKRRAAAMVQPGLKNGPSLSRQDLLDGLAFEMGVFIYKDGPRQTSIGVADVDFLAALFWLAKAAAEASVMIDGRAAHPGVWGFSNRALAAQSVSVSFLGADGETEELQVEPYFCRQPGLWVSSNSKNAEARAIYDDRLTTPGKTDLMDVLGGPSFATFAGREPVDVVYTWVNHDDPDWAAAFTRYKRIAAGKPVSADKDAQIRVRPQSADATALSRFHSNDELRYSLRSVAKNLTWANRIFVFTNCAPPSWLNREHPGIVWVHHDDVIPKDYLPTFSSHVIESYLHRIPGLSERFIYINDDVFVGRPLDKGFFFSSTGVSFSLLESYGMVSGQVKPGDPDYLNASRNSARLIQDTFGFVPTRLHLHTTFALRRDVLEEMEVRWPDEFSDLRHNRFRTEQDINVTSFLYHHYCLATGAGLEGRASNAFIRSSDISWRAQLAELPYKNPQIICLNEGGNAALGADWHAAVRAYLQGRWPDAAPWENA